MVQIVNRQKQEPQRMGQGFSQAILAMNGEREQQQARQQENESIKKLTGLDLSGVQDPKIRQMAYQLAGEKELQLNKLQDVSKFEDQRYNTVKEYFGPKAAELFRSAPEGGKTELLKGMIDAAQRGLNFEDVLSSQIPKELPESDKYAGLTPKEKAERKKLEYTETRREETALSRPILQEIDKVRKNIPLQEQAIDDIISASSEISPMDYFAEVTGFEPARSESGAKLKTALKDFFLSDLSRAGARPNMWIEQQLSDALPKIGRSVEANYIVAEGLKFKVDLAKKRMEIIDKLAEKDRDKFGYVKGNIDSRAFDQMKPYVIKRQKELKDNIEKIKKNKILKNAKTESMKLDVLGPDGQLYEIDSNEIDLLPEGYIVQ